MMNIEKAENKYIRQYQAYLQLEKGLSKHSIEAYIADIYKLIQFLQFANLNPDLTLVKANHINRFAVYLNDLKLSPTSQARIL